MRSATRTIAIAVLLIIGLALPSGADEFVACWSDRVIDPITGLERPVTRCRLSGGEVVDYASDTSVPVPLNPAAGTDLTGDCWYLTSRSTNWVYLSLFVDGTAILGFDPDPAIPGGIAYATGRIPRCTSEPDAASDPFAEVWAYVTAYIHPPPAPDLNPPTGDGVTGLATFAGVTVPDDHTATLGAGGASLTVEINVDGVVVEWGDGDTDTYPADPDALSGFPDGIANHIYETKTSVGYDLSVSYDWTARWRSGTEPWIFLDVPNTTTTVIYPVAEIISVITN